MKIGVVADTHSLDLPAKLLKALEKTDLIVHAGDFCSLKEYKVFKNIKPVKAVSGNCDETSLLKKLPVKDIFEIGGVNVGLFHGEGSARTTLDSVINKFIDDDVDVVIYGHTHEPVVSEIHGVTYFNPGSPNDIITAPYCSYGLMEIKNGKFKINIKKI